ncbi:salicylate hydroxylase [Blastomonas natatoria]|uniref:Salicylate hydroxylase n=1 Tax=Blastomonas natatoria TaxID=34015 RepID=A0A2V3VA37_9SPHN|nr:FAD-dependent monooxygenase [Blastomonas natatoria]PXW78004.1 salicylate hydroxylase [Blastomonas natatoria]
MRILIAGAGIAGLAAALALARKDHDVRVVEQAAAIEEVGAGLQLGPNAMRVLDSLGIGEKVAAAGQTPAAITLRDGRSAREILKVPLGDAAKRRWGAAYVTLHRADLVAILAEALEQAQPGALSLGVTVAQVDNRADGIAITTASGAALTADLLIGADGIRSMVREQLFGADTPRFTGHIAWRALVRIDPADPAAPPPGVGAWLGPRRHAVTYRIRPDLVNLVAVTEQADWREEGWNLPGDADRLRADFAGWNTLAPLLARVKGPLRWALFDRKPMRTWHRNRAVLIGDACHPMLPFLAQGAAMGIEDGYALAELLPLEPQHIEPALARFFALRQPRTARIQAMARSNGVDFHEGNPLATLAMRLPLGRAAATRPDAVMARWDWLYGGGPLGVRSAILA